MKSVLLFVGVSVFLFCSSSAGASDEVDMGQAENNYQAYCTPCHGRDGDGKGDLAESMEVPPRNHTDASIMSKRTDEQIFKTISLGGEASGFSADMPAHSTVIPEGEIRGLVKVIRRLCQCEFKK